MKGERKMKRFIKRNSSSILTGVGVISLGATLYSSITETIKANEILKNPDGDLTTKEKLINLLPQYKKTIIFAATTVACMISSNVISVKQQKQLLSSYMLLQQAYAAFKDKARELHGDEGIRDIYKAIMAEERPPHVDADSVLFYDTYSGKYFDATESDVLRAEMYINRKFAECGYVDVNEFYKQLGDNMGIKNGDEYGWSAYDAHETIWINFKHELCVMDDGLECYIIHMDVEPRHCLSSGTIY